MRSGLEGAATQAAEQHTAMPGYSATHGSGDVEGEKEEEADGGSFERYLSTFNPYAAGGKAADRFSVIDPYAVGGGGRQSIEDNQREAGEEVQG